MYMTRELSNEALAEMVEEGFDQLSEEIRQLCKDLNGAAPESLYPCDLRDSHSKVSRL
jgi:hypothetical protein